MGAIVPLAIGLVTSAPLLYARQGRDIGGTKPPAEEARLNNDVFRAGLRKRGLTELLQRHLELFPPDSSSVSLLMMRDVRLEEYADKALPRERRRNALADANRILERVIREFPDDSRRFQWRYDLARSLIYEEADPYLTNLLYLGGSATDRERLLSLSTKAVDVLRVLATDLAREYARVDDLAIRDYEKLESTGLVERLDQLAPRADYLLLWALFYNALPRSANDPTRARRLNRIVEKMEAHPAILNTPHQGSRVQVQALVLSGMTLRRLNHHHTAGQRFDRAINVADRLEDPAERQRVEWAVTLGWVERVRNDADDLRFDQAANDLAAFRTLIARERADDFKLRFVAALLERSVFRQRAEAATRAGRDGDAARYRRAAWASLADLTRREPDRRDEIYARLYEQIDPQAPVANLDPVEQSALIAGLLFDATQVDRPEPVLQRAVDAGTYFLNARRSQAPSLLPEVLFNTAVAHYRLGRPVEAARLFLQIARDHAGFDNALQAATFAVQLGSKFYEDPALHEHPEVQALYGDALRVLVTDYADSDAARYWRFYYAQWLDENGHFGEAATEYGAVETSHEHYLESAFARTRCLAQVLRALAAEASPDQVAIQRESHAFFTAQRSFLELALALRSRPIEVARAAALEERVARAEVLKAEVQALPAVDRVAEALETLTDFEERHVQAQALVGRVWKVRLSAFERLGKLDEATRAIPRYVDADPANAGAALQSLYEALVEGIKRLEEAGEAPQARRKSEMALVIAKQLHAWAGRPRSQVSTARRRTLAVQLAEAHLRIGQYESARDILAPLVRQSEDEVIAAPDIVPTDTRPGKDLAVGPVDAAGKESAGGPDRAAGKGKAVGKEDADEKGADDPRLIAAYAEALYELGEFAEALPSFNHLAITLPPSNPTRWRALLRDLQCRTALGHPPEGIIKVIKQQQFLYADLGGSGLAEQFEKLRRQNERRAGAD